ncbi:porin family protein [Hymenobacter antarcticus]|uniref:Outer membrane protein beta-barrel domain-containing protein n=1 Tax=Hymenobacter antarcticus TaxID=486270 RepID=A0ABP7QYV6_9BACT
MKKVLLSLGLLVGVASAANAQEARFGIKAGVNLANVTNTDVEAKKNLIGFAAGVMADFSFSDLISLHPEVLFSQKGVKFEDGKNTAQIRTNYIDVPVLLRVKADGLFFEAGPQVGFLASQKFEANGTTITTSTDGTRKVDVGYIAGVGYQLPQGLELGVRYNGGISDLSDPSAGEKTRNSVFQFQVGYLFGGK